MDSNQSSLRIKWPNIPPFLWSAFFILCICSVLELCTYCPWFNSIIPFPSPSIASSFPELDVKFQRFHRTDNIDCLFFGSSMVDADLDPLLFETILHQDGGFQYTCFNMGFSGSMVETSGAVATTLAHWQPLKVVVFGISPIEMDKNYTKTRWIAKMPVFTYYNVAPSITGWLFNTFNLPWYFASLPRLRDVNYVAEQSRWDQLLDDRGVRRSTEVGKIERGNQKALLPGFKINPVDMDVFQSTMTDLKSRGISVIVVEMPVHPEFFPYLVEGGDAKYREEFLFPIEEFLERNDIQFLRTQPVIGNLVEDSHWTNKNHLNFEGAEKFTSFIAHKILSEGFLR